MGHTVLIESRDPFESRDVPYCYGLAADLAARGETVTLFLVQNGVLAARATAVDAPLAPVLAANVTVRADAYSLRERGIADGDCAPGVQSSDVDALVALAMSEPGTKVLWH